MGRVTRQKVRFEKIETPEMVRIALDWTDVDRMHGTASILPAKANKEQWKRSLVKVAVRYREADAERAEQEIAAFLSELRKGTAHVFPVEKQIVRASRARDERMAAELSPLDAFLLWCQQVPEAHEIGAEAAKRVFLECAEGVAVGASLQAKRFMLSAVGVEDYIPFGGKHEVSGLAEGVYGIVGAYEGNARRSNRAGKSAFLKAILTALFGDDRAELGRGESVDRDIHAGKDGYRLALGIALDDVRRGEMEIERRRARDGKVVALVDGAKCSVTSLNEQVERELRFRREDFTKIAFVRAKDLNGIVGTGNSQMKSDLTRWLGLEHWAEIHANAHRRLLQLEERLSRLAADEGEARSRMDIRIMDLAAKPTEEQLEGELALAREKADALADAIAEQRAGREAARLRQRRQEAFSDLQQATEAVEFEGKLHAPPRLLALLEERVDEIRGRAGEIRETMIRVEATQEGLREQEEKFKQSGACPIEKMIECPLHERIVELIAVKDASRKEASSLADAAREKLGVLERGERNLSRLLDEVSGRVERARVLRKMISELDERIAASEAKDPGEMLDEASEELQIQRDASLRLEQALAEVRGMKKRVGEERERLKAIAAEAEALRPGARVLRLVRRACGRDGIPTLQLENALASIEAGANAVLGLVEAPHRVAFSFQRELKKLSDTCPECGAIFDKTAKKCGYCGEERRNKRSEDISLEIVDGNGRTQDFAQDSSGGQTLAALALRVALAQRFGFSSLFLDEVCAHLDDENLEMLVRLLTRLRQLGFDQIFVVSHRQRVRLLLEKLVVVERDDAAGRSRFFLQA